MAFEEIDEFAGAPVFHMHWFQKGMEVEYLGRPYMVENTILRGPDLYVRLRGLPDPIRSDSLSAPLTTFSLTRVVPRSSQTIVR